MSRLAALQQERNHKALSQKEIVERAEKDNNRSLTPEECQLFDKLDDERKSLDVQIANIQETESRRARLNETIENLNKSQRTTAPEMPANGAAVGNGRMTIPANARKRLGSLKAFKGPLAEESAYRAGQWLLGWIFGNERARHWCGNNGLGNDIRNALSTSSNPDGGFLVPEELSMAIIDLRESFGVFRRETRVVPMGRDTMLIPRRLTGVTISAIGENPSSAISQSNPTWNQVGLTAKKAGGLCLMSTEVAEDAVIDLADWLAQEFAYGFANFEDTCGFTGTGAQSQLGIRGLTDILTTASSLAGAVAAASGHDTFAEVDSSDLAKLMGTLPEYATPNARFYCSRFAAEMVFGRLQQNAGGNTIGDLSGSGVGRSYVGYPVVVSQVLPSSSGTINGTALLFFGDLSKSSTMGDRREVRIFPSEHRYMDTDQIGIRGTERIDIVNHDTGSTTAAGP
ncbi:MAG TPA: phage major capsid protein, partial [Gemmataceae bacterium]|nr:phage major capsid protein [Gemmataceae bacterium]